MAGVFASPFSPQATNSTQAITVNLAVTAGSARVAVLGANTASNQSLYTIRVSNIGTIPVFIEMGDSTITAATATGLCVRGSSDVNLQLPSGATHVAGIATTTGATIYCTPGSGAS